MARAASLNDHEQSGLMGLGDLSVAGGGAAFWTAPPRCLLAEDFLVEGSPVVEVVEVDGARVDGTVVNEPVCL